MDLSDDIPAAEGWNTSTAAIQLQNVTMTHFHQVLSYVVLENGTKVAEYYNKEEGANETTHHQGFSITKSWTSLLVGILASSGKVSVNETLGDIWPDEFNQIWPYVDNSTYHKGITVEELLTMSSGCNDPPFNGDMLEAINEGIFAGTNLTQALNYPNCSDATAIKEFHYMNDNILSYIILERSGMPPQDLVSHYVMPYLGMTNGTWEWQKNLDGVAYTSAGFSTTTMNYAKFGQLYLQNGLASETKRIVPQEWITNSATGHIAISSDDPFRYLFKIDPNMTLTYGYRFWIFDGEEANVYCAYGAGGHFICIWPDLARVLAVNPAMSSNFSDWLGYDFVSMVAGIRFASENGIRGQEGNDQSAASSAAKRGGGFISILLCFTAMVGHLILTAA